MSYKNLPFPMSMMAVRKIIDKKNFKKKPEQKAYLFPCPWGSQENNRYKNKIIDKKRDKKYTKMILDKKIFNKTLTTKSVPLPMSMTALRKIIDKKNR